MDYSKLTKKELIALCEKKNINYSSKMLKAEIEKLLINNATAKNVKKQIDVDKSSFESDNDSIGRAGSIINIVSSSIIIFFSFIMIILFICGVLQIQKIISDEMAKQIINPKAILIPIFIYLVGISIGSVCSIISNVRFLKGKNNKIMAGILGLFFSGFIGGILVLISKRR